MPVVDTGALRGQVGRCPHCRQVYKRQAGHDCPLDAKEELASRKLTPAERMAVARAAKAAKRAMETA